MAQNVQNVTLSLTLPITCHICLGKVRHPVICANHHVFCSVCIDVWLKNNSQCPACRIPITPENPCKEVIGGTSESNPAFSPVVRKQLRKTRLELVHKEYEDEIESLQNELEELTVKNLSLESQLKSALHPVSLDMSDKNQKASLLSEDGNSAIQETLVALTQKLQTTHEMYEKAKEDMEKLMEVNKKLRFENGGLMRENLRLKAEVGSRSPQKFGRFTVAALQSKLDQCERETNRLKKALERSDKYIEELESQVSNQKRESEPMKEEPPQSEASVPMEEKESESPALENTLLEGPEECPDENCLCATHCPDDNQPSGGLLGSSNDVCLNSASQGCSDESITQSSAGRDVFTGSQEGLLDVAGANMETSSEQTWDKIEDCVSYKEELYELPDPCMPLSLSCLQLNTPSSKDDPPTKEESPRKTCTFLRKLVFEDFGDASDDGNKDSPEHSASSCDSGDSKGTCFTADKPIFWDRCQTRYDGNVDYESSDSTMATSESGESSAKSSVKSSEKAHNREMPKKPHSVFSEMNRTRTSSEASMDAAYLDKISELDSMMSESDNSKSPYYSSKSSSDLENSCKATQCPDLLKEKEKTMKERSELKCPLPDDHSAEGSEWKSATFSILSPSALDVVEPFPLFGGRTSETSDAKPQSFLFQRQLSPSFLFNNSGGSFEEQKLGSSLFKVAPELQNLHNQLQSPWSSSFVPDRKVKSLHTSTKRKIQSSLSSASPSKTTKN